MLQSQLGHIHHILERLISRSSEMANSTESQDVDENQPLLRQTSPKSEQKSSTLYLKLAVLTIDSILLPL